MKVRCGRDEYLEREARTGVDLIFDQDTLSPNSLRFEYQPRLILLVECRDSMR